MAPVVHLSQIGTLGAIGIEIGTFGAVRYDVAIKVQSYHKGLGDY